MDNCSGALFKRTFDWPFLLAWSNCTKQIAFRGVLNIKEQKRKIILAHLYILWTPRPSPHNMIFGPFWDKCLVAGLIRLLENGAPFVVSSGGETVLHTAARAGQVKRIWHIWQFQSDHLHLTLWQPWCIQLDWSGGECSDHSHPTHWI